MLSIIGGFSALTWAQLNTHLSASVECRVYAVDLRGHGDTTVHSVEEETDLSAERLANDVLKVVDKILGKLISDYRLSIFGLVST